MSGRGVHATRHRPAVDFAAIRSGDTAEVGHCETARWGGGGSIRRLAARLLVQLIVVNSVHCGQQSLNGFSHERCPRHVIAVWGKRRIRRCQGRVVEVVVRG